MSRRNTRKLDPRLERFEEKCLLSVTLSSTRFESPGAAFAETKSGPTPLHGTESAGMARHLLHVPHKHPTRSSNFSLVSVSNPLPAPVGRVQVDQIPLVSGMTYRTMSVLEVINQTGTTISRGRFAVGVAGSTFKRSFPESAWQPGTVLVFFAPASVQNFAFHVPGPVGPIPPNVYFNVTYHPSTFTTTLHNLINSSHGLGGRFALT